MDTSLSRRRVIGALAATAMPAASYERILGANDRIQIGELGVGHRASGHRQMLKLTSKTDPNFELRSVCDLWSVNRERAAGAVQKMFGGTRPKTYKYSEEMLADKELDAVMIATGDHQHARILAEVVKAGKDCYCEKPMANTLEDAKLARDTVKASKQVVQMGSQWLSCPYQQQVREIIRSVNRIASRGWRRARQGGYPQHLDRCAGPRLSAQPAREPQSATARRTKIIFNAARP